jgi:hypothetical protein
MVLNIEKPLAERLKRMTQVAENSPVGVRKRMAPDMKRTIIHLARLYLNKELVHLENISKVSQEALTAFHYLYDYLDTVWDEDGIVIKTLDHQSYFVDRGNDETRRVSLVRLLDSNKEELKDSWVILAQLLINDMKLEKAFAEKIFRTVINDFRKREKDSEKYFGEVRGQIEGRYGRIMDFGGVA